MCNGTVFHRSSFPCSCCSTHSSWSRWGTAVPVNHGCCSCHESIFIQSSKLNTFGVVLVWPMSAIICAAIWMLEGDQISLITLLLVFKQTNDLIDYSVFIRINSEEHRISCQNVCLNSKSCMFMLSFYCPDWKGCPKMFLLNKIYFYYKCHYS